jgi:hypothetical protein
VVAVADDDIEFFPLDGPSLDFDPKRLLQQFGHRRPKEGFAPNPPALAQAVNLALQSAKTIHHILVHLLKAVVNLLKALVNLLKALVNLLKALVNLLKALVNLLKALADFFEPGVHLRPQLQNILTQPAKFVSIGKRLQKY